jgi:hypothetical protein
MKTLFTFVLIIFSIVFSNAQNLLFSEDFDYPIGSNLNQYNWRPLSVSATNPIKITDGLSSKNYPASGGAAYLKKSGQDLIRTFQKISNGRVYLSFQIKIEDIFTLTTSDYIDFPKFPNPYNYFMFLSSEEQPTIPLLKFSLTKTNTISNLNFNKYYVTVTNSVNQPIAILYLNYKFSNDPEEKIYTVSFSYDLTGYAQGVSFIRSDGINSIIHPAGLNVLNYNLFNNLSNICLAQSNKYIGSEVTVDRIRIGKTWESVMPCVDGIEEDFLKNVYEDNTALFPNLQLQSVTENNILLKTCANTEVTPTSGAKYRFTTAPKATDLIMAVPNGFKLNPIVQDYTKNTNPNEIKTAVNDFTYDYTYGNSTKQNQVEILLTGNSNRISPNGNPITGDAGVYEGEVSFTPTGGYCKKVVWKIRGVIEDCKSNPDLMLKEDFEYPIGEELVRHNWQPLNSSSSNPIKTVKGLEATALGGGFSASGGAAYLNKSGADLKRAFKTIDKDDIYLTFQYNPKSSERLINLNSNKIICNKYADSLVSSANYFMFLSSKEEPTKPLLKFSLVSAPVCFDYINYNYLIIKDVDDKVIAKVVTGNEDLRDPKTGGIYTIRVKYTLSGANAGKIAVGISRFGGGGTFNPNINFKSINKIKNLGHIVLAQSDGTVGSELIIDRIKIGTTLASILEDKNTVAPAGFVEAESLNAAVYPNTTAGRIDLLIDEKAPEGDFEIRLSDKAGNNLYSNSGTWENQQGEIERILSRSQSGQYLFTVKQGNSSKTIRVFRQE